MVRASGIVALAPVAALALATPVAADEIAARFAARPSATQMTLAPDGDKVVYIGAYKTGGHAVFVADLKTGETNAIVAGSTLAATPRSCDFKTETKMICVVGGVSTNNAAFGYVMTVDTDGRNRSDQHATGGRYYADVIDWLPDDPAHVLIGGDSVSRMEVATGRMTLIESGSAQTMSFDSDQHGNIRLRSLTDRDPDNVIRDVGVYYFRAQNSRAWQPLLHTKLSDERASAVLGFDEAGDHLLMLAPRDGRQALFSVAADESKAQTLLFAHPQVDIDGVVRIGKYRRPVAATYTLERDEVHYFDPKLATLAASLRRVLPGNPDVKIVDESWDGTKKLVYTDSTGRPGRYFLYDERTRKLGELLATYPGLDGVALGRVEAITYRARDGTVIPGFLTLPPGATSARGLPAIVMPHGGPSSRDAAGFDWFAQFFAAQGFAVLQPNFRGSAGYGDAFFAKNGFKSWPLAIGDVNDGARWLIAQGVPVNRLAIVGWSYGGYAALQANVVEPTLYRATVAVAPVTDLDLLRERSSHYTNYKLMIAMIGTGDGVRQGSPARNAAKIVAPVLIFHANHDKNVDIEQSQTMVSALRGAGKKVTFVEYKNLDHQIDDSVAREDLLTKSAAFLKAAMD